MNATTPAWRVTWIAGPDAGASVVLAAGSHVVGRARQAALSCDDPRLEPFHARLDLAAGGGANARAGEGAGAEEGAEASAVTVLQLAGRRPVHRDVSRHDVIVIDLGSSALEVRSTTEAPGAAELPVTAGAVRREPRSVPVWAPDPVIVPTADTAGGIGGGGGGSAAVVPAVVGMVGTAVVALVLRQAMFVVFGAIGLLAAVSTWAVGFVRQRRERRRRERDDAAGAQRLASALAAQHEAWAEHCRTSTPTLVSALASIGGRAPALWQRRAEHGDAFVVSCGIGAVPWVPVMSGSWSTATATATATGAVGPPDPHGALAGPSPAEAVPVAVDVGPGARLGVTGPFAGAVVRSLVVQLAATTGPSDWQLVVVTDHAHRWDWAAGLPHLADASGHCRIIDGDGAAELVREPGGLLGRLTVVVTDQLDALTVRTSALRRMLSGALDTALIAVVGDDGTVPAVCRSTITTTTDGRARLVADLHTGAEPVAFRVAGLGVRAARRCATALAGRTDPEDPTTAERHVPVAVELHELLAAPAGSSGPLDPLDAGSVAAHWSAVPADPAPRTPIGVAADGVVDIDLVRDGPHALLAGTTGAGKSELLRSLVLGLACRLAPQAITFVLVDYKGGATFDSLARLPHVVGVVTDLDVHLAGRALRSLRAELTARERMLREHAASDLTSLRAQLGVPVVPRLVVVVDEFAALAVEQAGFLHALVGIAQRGRSLGVHLVLATQRPSGVISDDIRANTNLRLALRLHDAGDSTDVLGDPVAATLPRTVPGRAVMRLGPDELVVFQAACSSTTDPMVESIVTAARRLGITEPRRPWCEPLPHRLGPHALIDGGGPAGAVPDAIGLVDLPDEQAQRTLRWSPTDGNVVVAGATGSGVTSTLLTAVSSMLIGLPGARHDRQTLFVIDAHGDARWDALAAHPRCAGVVRLHERERLLRLLTRVAAAPPTSTAVLVVDGLAALRHELDPLERSGELALLDRIVLDGAGAVVLLGVDGPGGLPGSWLARCPHRWVLHLHDPHDSSPFGVTPADAVPAVPGRAALGGAGAHVQFRAPGAEAALPASIHVAPVDRIGVLPAVVGLPLPERSVHGERTWSAAVGIDFERLDTAVLDVPDGEHLLVVGPARSGRSQTLVQLHGSWGEALPHGDRVVVAPRRSPLGGVATADADEAVDRVLVQLHAGRPVLLVVDDAELVHDASGRLAELVGSRRPGLTVVAAGRPDALRQAYGHWTVAVRRSRLGVLMAGAHEADADLLGASLPRWCPLADRPGLAHLVDGGSTRLVQMALAAPPTAPTAPAEPDRDRLLVR